MMRRDRQLSFENIRTWSSHERVNLVKIEDLKTPGVDPAPAWENADFDELVERVVTARRNGRPVILSMGAHVIKNWLSRYLIALIQTGGWMNEAIQEGARRGLGYGCALAAYMDEHPEKFPHLEDCVLYQAYKADVPATYHIALGTDIIHQHPTVDFAAIGKCSGIDFHKFCYSVSELEGGVYMNFGSGVIGPEVFLKALSIARNLGHPTREITTANFDLIDLGDFRKPIGYDDPNYYYRPRKNIVNRPVSTGGKGWHFVVDHKVSIPNLYERVMAKTNEEGFEHA